VKVVSVVPGGDARGALNASWGEVMSHVNTRMGFVDPLRVTRYMQMPTRFAVDTCRAPKRGSGVDSSGAVLWYKPLDLIDFTAFW
jgi:hypothetical protein